MDITLITGANKGIGYEAARGLKKLGHTVLVGARDEERGRGAAEELGAHFVRIDVTDEASIAAAAKRIEAEFGRLDVLVNNAGVSLERVAPSESSVGRMRELYEVNVFGVVAVTNAMLPLLRRSTAARIVNLSSELGSFGLLGDPGWWGYSTNLLAYNSAKAAVNAITLAYAKELTGMRVNAINPGYCATDLNGHQGFRTAEQGAAVAVAAATLPADGVTGAFFGDEGPLPW